MKISVQSLEKELDINLLNNWREIFMKQLVNKYR